MDYLKIVLRLMHVFGGAFWFGAAMIMGFFVAPAVAATAEAGQKVMGYMVLNRRIHTAIYIAAGLTILGGAGLYWLDSDGFTSAWMQSGPGMVFGIGGFFGLIGFIFGSMVGSSISKLATIGSQAQGKPTPEQMSQIQAAQKRLAMAGPISSICLIITVLLMSVARYWANFN